MRFAFIARHRHIWTVSWRCKALEVLRSGFHAWLNRPTGAHEIHDAKLVTAIETSFKASDRTYCPRRVWRNVLEEGLACRLHRIERLIRLNTLRAVLLHDVPEFGHPMPFWASVSKRKRCNRERLQRF